MPEEIPWNPIYGKPIRALSVNKSYKPLGMITVYEWPEEGSYVILQNGRDYPARCETVDPALVIQGA